MSINHTKPGYRNDIDGLRAIAVILVILFHAGFEWLPSGFIGVDIFFVISGYLITGIILTQLQEERFSLSNFLIGRLWRIQPALIMLSLCTLITVSFLYVVEDYITFLKSAKYNSLFLSNQFFAKQSVTYASPESEFFPLLHTWSLSVEWQWYLFLPLILMATYYLINYLGFNVGGEKEQLRKRLLCWLVATILLCAIALALSYKSHGQSYYSLLARAFEFTAGGCIVLLNRIFISPRRWLLSLLSVVSLLAIFYVAKTSDVIDTYPNVYTVTVVLATAVMIFSGSYNEKLLSGLLSQACVTFIGRLSYSLYLWHWPVLVLFRYKGISLHGYTLIVALIIIVVLSLLSYYYVEKPLRKKRIGLKSTLTLLVLFPIVAFSGLYSLSIKYNGFPERLGDSYALRQGIIKSYEVRSGNRSVCLNDINDPLKCQLGSLNAKKTALMIGDSNSNHFWGFFDDLANAADIKLTALSESSCLTLPGLWQFDWWIYKNAVYDECHKKTQSYFNLIKSNHYDYVIIGEIWEQYANGPHLISEAGDLRSDALSKERMNRSIREALDIIVESGARPIFIKTINFMPAGYQECINHVAINREDFIKSSCNSLQNIDGNDEYVESLFSKLKSEYPALIVIDPKDAQCLDGKCVTQIDGVPLYRDVGHLTDFASYKLGEIYLKRMGNPFSK